MKVNFILPNPIVKIAGGYKMVFIYANFLVRNNVDVTIYFATRFNGFKSILDVPFRYFVFMKGIDWFPLSKKVRTKFLVYRNCIKLSSCDINISTASALLPMVLKGNNHNVIHFIQDHEKWVLSENELFKIYSYPVPKIVIAKWLMELVSRFTEQNIYHISNGIDLAIFKLTNPIPNRFSHSVAMLYHTNERKGCNRGLNILYKIKDEFPDLKCTLFGSPDRPQGLPAWIEYHKNANQIELGNIYNANAIFFCTSYFEGFGLTGLEAMACGCALVSSDTLGVREYAKDNLNALLSPPNDDNLLYMNLLKLLGDNDLRISLATEGQKYISEHSQDYSNKRFLDTLIIEAKKG